MVCHIWMMFNCTAWHHLGQHWTSQQGWVQCSTHPPKHGASHGIAPHLWFLLRSHEELLLANPGLSLVSIQVVLLGLSSLPQAPVPGGCLLLQHLPQCPQLLCLYRQLWAWLLTAPCCVSPAEHLTQAGGMARQLLLQCLPAGGKSQ